MLLTRPPLRIKTNPYSPFDLHVLSVPPAFVLSQDQTLYKSCISISVSTELRSLFNNACVITAHFYTLCLSFPFFKGISRVVTLFALFNFQDAVSCFALLRNTFIISHSEDFVKYFFQVFSKFSFRDLRCSLQTSFSIISHSVQFVKYFFQVF